MTAIILDKKTRMGDYFWLPCSPISPYVQGRGGGGSAKIFFSLVMKTKLVQNVNRMSERQNNMPKDRLTDRQTDRKTDRKTFQLSYQNKSCQQDVRKIERQTDKNRNHGGQLKSPLLFRQYLSISTTNNKTSN